MPTTGDAFEALRLLSDETRWRLINALRMSDYQVGELVTALNLPQNLVSYHLGLLRQVGLVQAHRSDADGRIAYYTLNVAALDGLYRQIGAELRLETPAAQLPACTVLFLCTANSARSQMAEGWLRHLSGGRVVARSAGTAPATLHPLAVEAMAEAGVDIGYQRTKALAEVAALTPDIVVTVCDLAREQCPAWPGAMRQIHWSIPDPAHAPAGPPAQAAFRTARDELHARVLALLALLSSPGFVP